MNLPLMNKERIVFLGAVSIFLIGLATLLGRAPLTGDDPTLPGEPAAENSVKVKTLSPLFPGPGSTYTRTNPFTLYEVWGPPKPGRLPDLPEPPPGYAVPRVSLDDGLRVDILSLQTHPPKEAIREEAPPDEEGVDGEAPDEEAGG